MPDSIREQVIKAIDTTCVLIDEVDPTGDCRANQFMKRILELILEECKQPYSDTCMAHSEKAAECGHA